MKTGVIAALTLFVGICVGYFGLGLLYPYPHISTQARQTIPDAVVRNVVACDLSPDQISHLSASIAPEVVARLATSGLSNIAIDPKIAAQQRQASEQDKAEQAEAFTRASQLVDQMIANRRITPEGLNEAHQLLQQTNQADRMVEISGRIAVAVNKGQLTPVQAGLTMPGARQ
ncbi:MAG TPA: hypothetical protein VHL14_05855 [Steroidobacteraceae bacterium]|nr:hypothetical protein [Steroidobacteraceae bacterium]